MLRFTLFKIPISIHWMFWLLAAFLGGAMSVRGPEDWMRVFIFMAAATFSILIHELGHALVGLRLGAPRAEILLHSMGGLASFGHAPFSRKERILMTAAGPGASIGLAILFYFIANSFFRGAAVEPSYSWMMAAYFVQVVIVINVFWSIINLMPILPLDGGQILLAVLGPDRVRATCIISFVTLAVLAVLLWMSTQSIFNMIVMALLASHTWKIYQANEQRG